jgi:CubicO group peptidase (beta-lactamase class C family)
MKDTAFRPASEKKGRIAATFGDEALQFTGDPQDYLARQLSGVAGHAGLFSTTDDLALFCRMILGGGQLAGKRVMEQRTVNQMTAPYFSRGGRVIRGLGWDIASPFSSPRGSFFSRISFGHTGYSGSSLWIDPDADLYVILLTTRLEYRKKSEFNQLRSDLSTLAVEAFGAPPSLKELEDAVDVE